MSKRLVITATAVVAVATMATAAFVVLRSELRELRRETRDVRTHLRGLQGRVDALAEGMSSQFMREACRSLLQVREALAGHPRGRRRQEEARKLVAEQIESARTLATNTADVSAAERISQLASHLDAFLIADASGARAARDTEITAAAKELELLEGRCANVQSPLGWRLPVVSAGRAYPVTLPGTRVVERPRCDWWGSDLTLGRRMCVLHGPRGGIYSLTSRVIREDSYKPIANAKITYYVQGITSPIVTWSNRWGDFAFIGIPVNRNTFTCAWRVTTSRDYGRQIAIEPIDGDSYQGLVFLRRQPEIIYLGDIHPPFTCRRWVPPALRHQWPTPPDLG